MKVFVLAALNRRIDEAPRASVQPVNVYGLFAVALADSQLGKTREAWKAFDRADDLMNEMAPPTDIYAAFAYFSFDRPKRGVVRLEHAVRVEPECGRYIVSSAMLNRFKSTPEFADFVARHPG